MNPLKTYQLTSGYVRCKLPGRSLIFSALLDSGNLSSYDLMSESLTKKIKIQVNPAHLELGTAAKGKRIQVIGQCQPFKIYIESCGEMFEIAPYVVQGLSTNLNLRPRFLAKSNCDLKFREDERPELIIRNGERELDLLGNDVMNLPSSDEVFSKILAHFHSREPRLVKNKVLDLGLEQSEEIMDLPGTVYAIEAEK